MTRRPCGLSPPPDIWFFQMLNKIVCLSRKHSEKFHDPHLLHIIMCLESKEHCTVSRLQQCTVSRPTVCTVSRWCFPHTIDEAWTVALRLQIILWKYKANRDKTRNVNVNQSKICHWWKAIKQWQHTNNEINDDDKFENDCIHR